MVNFLKNLIQGENEPKPKGYLWIVIIILLMALAVSIVFFSRSRNYDTSVLVLTVEKNQNGEKQPRIYTVFYKNGTFSPTNLRIRRGDTVRFENQGLFGIHIISDPHPEHNDLSGFDSVGSIPQGGIFTYTFAVPGIFGYHNERDTNEGGKIILK